MCSYTIIKKIIFIWSKESKRKLEAMGVARVVAGDIEKEGQRDIKYHLLHNFALQTGLRNKF